MASKIQIRRDTATNWTSADPTLAVGEMGYETDTGKIKFGDGATAWTSLAYHETTIDHDALTNFVANEHIDWTQDQGGTDIHSGNYTDTVYSHPNHSGEVTSTGDGAQALHSNAITNKTLVTASGADELLVTDASDSNNLKRVTAQSIADLGGSSGHTVQEEGSNLPARTNLNFIGNAVTATDNAGNDATDVTINHPTDLAAVQGRRSTSLTVTTSWSSVVLDVTDFENEPTRVKHNDTTTSRIDILEAGMYEVFYDVTVHADQDARDTESRIYVNGTTLLAGSDLFLHSDGANTTDNPVSIDRKVIANFAANDYVELQLKDSVGSLTANANITLIVTKLEGIQGADGAQGPAGDDYKTTLLADSFDNPVNANWAINGLAPAVPDSNNNALTVRSFDDTTEEGVGFMLEIPAGVTNMDFTFKSRAETTPAGARTVGLKLYSRGIPDNAAVESWSAGAALADIDLTTNEFFQYDTDTKTLASLGLSTGTLYQFQLTRGDPSAGTELSGDWNLIEMTVEFS